MPGSAITPGHISNSSAKIIMLSSFTLFIIFQLFDCGRKHFLEKWRFSDLRIDEDARDSSSIIKNLPMRPPPFHASIGSPTLQR